MTSELATLECFTRRYKCYGKDTNDMKEIASDLPSLEDYVRSTVLPHQESIEQVIVERDSMAPVLLDNDHTLAQYIQPLVDRQLNPDEIQTVVLKEGWFQFVLKVDSDGEKDDGLYIYFTPTPSELIRSVYNDGTAQFHLREH